MRKIYTTGFVILLCLLGNTALKAQNDKPFISYYISELQTVQKDSAGKWGDWQQQTKLKTMVFDFFIGDGDPAGNKVNIYYFKSKKPIENFSWAHNDLKEENGYSTMTLTGAKNSTGKPCVIEIKRSTDKSNFNLASLGVMTIKYDNEWIEYTGIL
jgi:hypothetical protein